MLYWPWHSAYEAGKASSCAFLCIMPGKLLAATELILCWVPTLLSMQAILLDITTCHVVNYACAAIVMLGVACKLSSLNNVVEAVAIVDLKTPHRPWLTRL